MSRALRYTPSTASTTAPTWQPWPRPMDRVIIRLKDGTTHECEAFKVDWEYQEIEAYRIVGASMLEERRAV